MIIDGHVRIGAQRETSLTVEDLIESMELLGVDVSLIAPSERQTAVQNREGNTATAAAAAASGGRLLPYAVATPWLGQQAVEELRRARDAGAVALAVDAALQGFDLLDGQLGPLLEFAIGSGWPIYVRTGTPPTALPMPLSLLARKYPEGTFLMGRSGATDFWIDAGPAMRAAPNLLADTAYAAWDVVLTTLGDDPQVGPGRMFFSTDSPYTVPLAELDSVRNWPIDDQLRSQVLGTNLARILGLTA